MKMLLSFLKIDQNKVKDPFYLKSALFVMLSKYFRNKILDKLYSNQLRSRDPKIGKNTQHSSPLLNGLIAETSALFIIWDITLI